jgi:hypothetical protein
MTDMDFVKYQEAQQFVKDFRREGLKNAADYIENGNTIVGFVKVDAPEEEFLGVYLRFPEEIVEQNGSVLVFITPIHEPDAGYTTVKVPLDVILGKAN